MAVVERDETDLVHPGADGRSWAQTYAEARRKARALRQVADPEPGAPSGPPALPAQRRAVLEQIRAERGWSGSSASALVNECPACHAAPTHWCRRGARVLTGFVHPGR